MLNGRKNIIKISISLAYFTISASFVRQRSLNKKSAPEIGFAEAEMNGKNKLAERADKNCETFVLFCLFAKLLFLAKAFKTPLQWIASCAQGRRDENGKPAFNDARTIMQSTMDDRRMASLSLRVGT